MFKTKKIILLLISIVLLLSFICIPVSADTIGLTVNMNKPRADNYSGYVEYLLNDNGKMYARTTFWHFSLDALTNGQDNIFPEVRVTVTNNRIVLTAITNDNDPSQSRNFNWIVGNVNSIDGGSGSDYACYNLDSTGAINAYWGNSQIMGYKIYGNGVNWDSSLPSGTYNWNIMYSETSMLYEVILSMAQSSANSSNSITQNATDNANNIQQNQDKNTQEIINNQNQLQQQEKDDAESSGLGSVDDVSGAIEDKSAGFISAISNLVGSMSYNGTSCAWSFPALKLPAIEGVMPEYQLTEEQPIDFEFWVNKIPADILVLVRSVLTIALIGYCFKELYGTISYVLTLKGGGNNE